MSTKTGFYAVVVGRSSGVFSTWAECEAQVKGGLHGVICQS